MKVGSCFLGSGKWCDNCQLYRDEECLIAATLITINKVADSVLSDNKVVYPKSTEPPEVKI